MSNNKYYLGRSTLGLGVVVVETIITKYYATSTMRLESTVSFTRTLEGLFMDASELRKQSEIRLPKQVLAFEMM